MSTPRPVAVEGLGLAHPLQLLYKASMKTGKIQIDLKRANITPIYKGGSRNLSKNYRPVALTLLFMLQLLEQHKILEELEKPKF